MGIREVNFNGANSGVTIIIPAKIHNHPVNVVVDSAAQVTVLGEKFVRSMQHPPKCCKEVRLRGAGENHYMLAKLAKGVNITIGNFISKCDVYIAPITDDVILGLDFLLEHKVKLDLEFNTFTIGSETIPATLK